MDNYCINNDAKTMQGINIQAINVENAVIEEITQDNMLTYITISYGILDRFNTINMTLVKLVVSEKTLIRNRQGNYIRPRELRVGSVINASFSARMTRSIPPQSTAFLITVVRDRVKIHPSPDFSNIVQDRIMEIDRNNNFILTGNPRDMMSQIRFVVNNRTEIFNRRGNRLGLKDLRPGQMIRVDHADFMTMSIPPQTVAYRILVL